MEQQGFILIHRTLFENPLLNTKPFCKGYAWVVLLGLANHKAGYIKVKNGTLVKVQRGECGHSEKALADLFGWSRGKLRRFLEQLKNEKMIQQKIVENHSIIKILNYIPYQTIQQNKKQKHSNPVKRFENSKQNNSDRARETVYFFDPNEQQTVQQKMEKQYSKKVDANPDYIYISKSELEKMIQQKMEKRTQTNNKRDINKLISLSIEEREILKNYLLELNKNRKNKIDDIDAYIRKLIDNGDCLTKLEKAKKRLERKKAKEIIPPPEKNEDKALVDAAMKKARAQVIKGLQKANKGEKNG